MITITFDTNKTLEELERYDWGDSDPKNDSHLISTCLKLRRKPLKLFSVEELRIMIGQSIGLRYLVPIALNRLRSHPFLHGDFFSGDLLLALVHAKSSFWIQNPEYCQEVHQIVQKLFLMGQKKKRRYWPVISSLQKEYPLFPKISSTF